MYMTPTEVPVNLSGHNNAGVEWIGGEVSHVKIKANNRLSGERDRREGGPEKSNPPLF